MPIQVQLKPIKPKRMPFDLKRFQSAELPKAFKKTDDAILSGFRQQTSSFKHQPSFRTKVISADRHFSGTENDIYFFLNFGTKRRWAVMSRNFRRGTTPGSLRSRSSSGNVIIAGKRAMIQRGMKSRKGITAGRWDLVIEKQVQPKHFGFLSVAILNST